MCLFAVAGVVIGVSLLCSGAAFFLLPTVDTLDDVIEESDVGDDCERERLIN